jgi:hypothetical protein
VTSAVPRKTSWLGDPGAANLVDIQDNVREHSFRGKRPDAGARSIGWPWAENFAESQTLGLSDHGARHAFGGHDGAHAIQRIDLALLS